MLPPKRPYSPQSAAFNSELGDGSETQCRELSSCCEHSSDSSYSEDSCDSSFYDSDDMPDMPFSTENVFRAHYRAPQTSQNRASSTSSSASAKNIAPVYNDGPHNASLFHRKSDPSTRPKGLTENEKIAQLEPKVVPDEELQRKCVCHSRGSKAQNCWGCCPEPEEMWSIDIEEVQKEIDRKNPLKSIVPRLTPEQKAMLLDQD